MGELQPLRLAEPLCYIFELPKGLARLQENMGKCPSCEKITENILLCLTCGWKICSKEKNQLLEHVKTHNGALFIQCYSGRLVFVFKGHLFARKSVYLNYLGEAYETNAFVATESSQYQLN